MKIKDCNSDLYPLKLPAKYLECNFSDGFCMYNHSSHGNFDWTIGRYTPSRETGPQTPFNGPFCYFEASGSVTYGRTAILESPIVYFNGPTCISFVYHMFGSNIGSFYVILKEYDEEKNYKNSLTILSKWGNQGNLWNSTSYSIDKNFERVIKIVIQLKNN